MALPRSLLPPQLREEIDGGPLLLDRRLETRHETVAEVEDHLRIVDGAHVTRRQLEVVGSAPAGVRLRTPTVPPVICSAAYAIG